MPSKRVIRAALIMDDVKRKLSSAELMAKYGLSAEELRAVLTKIICTNAAQESEVALRMNPLRHKSAPQRRKAHRAYVRFPLVIRDLSSPSDTAFVRDLSEKGFRIATLTDMASGVGRVQRFEIEARPRGKVDPLRVEATCRWVRRKVDRFNYVVAGYEITQISDASMTSLQVLLKSLNNRRQSKR